MGVFNGYVCFEQVGEEVMGFPTASLELFQELFDVFIKFDDVTSDGCDIFLEIA